MINMNEFLCIISQKLNPQQETVVKHPLQNVLQIVAGPGSGKTTVLILRALRLVFVEGIPPEHVLIVTFTKKAARELRSRWLREGEAIKAAIGGLDHVDLNRCQIGTLDSIVQQVMTDHRLPGETAPVTMDNATSKLMLRRFAFANRYQQNKQQLAELLKRYTFNGREPRNQSEALPIAQTLLERLVQDQVDLDSYRQLGSAQSLIIDTLADYRTESKERNTYDFTAIEKLFLDRLNEGTLSEWTPEVKALLVDEYQDTNPLQEAIYFGIINATGAIATIVGDDDQSLYRFRGGSVELFTEFETRCHSKTGYTVDRIDIVDNYRSTPEIVGFYNAHITSDPGFRPARINPPKQPVQAVRNSTGLTVLGIFRPDEECLAEALADFLGTLVNDRRYQADQQVIDLPSGGNLGDIAFLSHSVRERQYNWHNRSSEPRFPLKFRESMECRNLKIFNPRGQSLRDVPDVQRILGLLALIADPDGSTVEGIYPTNESKFFLNQWRRQAEYFVQSNPAPKDNRGLDGFVKRWQSAAYGQLMDSATWSEWPVLEIIYRLLTWFPEFQNEPEHQAWLQAIVGNIDSSTTVSAYEMKLLSNTRANSVTDHVIRSREVFIRDALIPIAEDNVDIDEDILPSIPRDYLQIMTIHQSKGLEFPMAIVDVGSRFRSNHHTQKFLRFPSEPSSVVRQENDIEQHLPTPLRAHRPQLDRTFDDLARLYYVAYSRPQSVLLLIGNEKCLTHGTGSDRKTGTIPNVALGWNRDLSWPWQESGTARPPIIVNTPFTRI